MNRKQQKFVSAVLCEAALAKFTAAQATEAAIDAVLKYHGFNSVAAFVAAR